MSVTLTSYPSASSAYYAVNNPLLYSFVASGRSAGAYNDYSYTGTFVNNNRLVLSGHKTERTDIKKGDVIRIVTPVYDLVLGVLAVNFTVILGQNITEVYLSENVPSPQTSITVTGIKDYRVECRLFHGRKEQNNVGAYIMRQVGNVVAIPPDSDGIVIFDVRPYLKSFVDISNPINIQKKNTIDEGIWGRFYVQYREKWEGDGKGDEDGWTPSTPGSSVMRYWVSGVKQVKSVGDVSMYPYITITDAVTMGEFLTAFNMPEYYIGYPNEISFAWKEEAAYNALTSVERKLTPLRAEISKTETDLLIEGVQGINRLQLIDATGADFLEVSIETDPTAPIQYVNVGYVQAQYFEIQ